MLKTYILLGLVPIALSCTNPDSDPCASYISANAAAASPFCATFTKSTVTATTGLPAWATNCSNKPSSISKECSCYYTGGGSSPTTTLKTSTTKAATTTTNGVTTRTTTGSVVTATSGGGGSSSCTSGYTVDQLVGYAAGTTGGGSGSATTVTTCAALEAALKVGGVIKISGTLSGCGVLRVPSNTSILGVGSTAGLTNGGFYVRQVTNVIIRNLKIQSPLSEDAIDVDESTYVWVDHCDLHALGLTGDKDDYDGLLDVKHGSDFVTISWTYFHDHWKASLVGHSDSNSGEDTGKLHVTYHHNWWYNINSRTPSIRFGTGHVYSSCYEEIPTSGVHARQGAKVRIEQNSFTNVHYAEITHLDSPIDGYIDDRVNILINSDTLITQTTSLSLPYSFTPTCAANVCAAVKAKAGVGIVTF